MRCVEGKEVKEGSRSLTAPMSAPACAGDCPRFPAWLIGRSKERLPFNIALILPDVPTLRR